MARVTVVGHKNPDNDSICSAVGYAHLMNQLDPANEYVPARLGDMPKESVWVSETYGYAAPEFVASVADLPAEEGLGRALARSGGRDRIEQAPLAFHRRLREGYLELARAEPGRFSLIDASAPTDDVTRAVWAAVSERLGPERAAAAPS